jgi:hypothetical protein
VTNTSNSDHAMESQRTIRYNPKTMSFREYDKKMLSFIPGLKYWKEVLENSYEWHKLVPELDVNGVQVLVNGVPNMIDKYTATEKDELQLTDRIAVSTYVQGNGPETDVYTDKPTAYEIRMALRDRFENINTMGKVL